MGFTLYLAIVLSLIAAVVSLLAASQVRFYERRARKRRDELLAAIGALRKEIARVEPPRLRPMTVKAGSEVIELDPELVARIEALAQDVRAGKVGSAFLQEIIKAGFAAAELDRRRENSNDPERKP